MKVIDYLQFVLMLIPTFIIVGAATLTLTLPPGGQESVASEWSASLGHPVEGYSEAGNTVLEDTEIGPMPTIAVR